MRVLLVEPAYRRNTESAIKAATGLSLNSRKRNEDILWYPPIGLMKLSAFHKRRGDDVQFVIGCDKKLFDNGPLFSSLWDRVYISTLFTFDWDNIISTINFYKQAVGGSIHKIFVGGIMATLMPQELFEETGIYPITGLLTSASKIDLPDDVNIDLLPPDYEILDGRLYAINDTYYSYTTRGCINNCVWCGVPEIEPEYQGYIDIKPMITEMRQYHGDKARLKLMDNNVLASPHLGTIVDDLIKLGYGRGNYTVSSPRRSRVVDFNQGLDATFINEENIRLLSLLNIRPMRIAFDRLNEKETYEKAIRLAHKHGFNDFSNYMLFNCNDTPRDLYQRLMINIDLNEEWSSGDCSKKGAIFSYPMRFAPIKPIRGDSKKRDYSPKENAQPSDYLKNAVWNKRFTRNIEIIKGVAHGAISPTSELAKRAIGSSYDEFIANLYMPEELLRYRNKYEKKRYSNDKARPKGTGDVEKFRKFILKLLKKQDNDFLLFHEAVSQGTKEAIRKYKDQCSNEEILKWLEFYLIKN